MKYQKSVKNANLNSPEPNMTSLNCFFWPNNSLKHKDSSFIIINNTEKQQILTLQRQNSNPFYFIWKITETINRLSKLFAISFPLID